MPREPVNLKTITVVEAPAITIILPPGQPQFEHIVILPEHLTIMTETLRIEMRQERLSGTYLPITGQEKI